MQSPEYRVRLELFEGPLDLLLHLIEKRELDITAISLAAIADQYLEYLDQASPDLDALADFLVVAAKLLVIKSLALFPQSASPETEDAAADLTQRLIEYQAIKRAAATLRALETQDQRCYPRLAAPPPRVSPHLAEGLTLSDLIQALQDSLSRLPVSPSETLVPRPVFSVVEKSNTIITRLAVEQKITFSALLMQSSCRAEAIATFLAVLDLLRIHRIEAVQEDLFGEIALLARPESDNQERDDDAGQVNQDIGDLGAAARGEALV